MLWRVQDILESMAPPLGLPTPLCRAGDIARALDAFNRAQEILMARHDWPGTTADVCFTPASNCITLPARFSHITACRVDGVAARLLPDGWQYLDGGTGGPVDMHSPDGLLSFIGDHFPTFAELPATLPVCCFSSEAEDAAATLRIHGLGADGSELRAASGVPGLSIPIRQAAPDTAPAMTPVPVSHITALVKPVTRGEVDVLAVDAATGRLSWLTRMGRHETAPTLTRYAIGGPVTTGTTIRARCSLRFQLQYALADIAIIQHREAMRLMAHALRAFDAEEGGTGSEFQNRAMKIIRDAVSKRETGHQKAVPVRRPMLGRGHFIR